MKLPRFFELYSFSYKLRDNARHRIFIVSTTTNRVQRLSTCLRIVSIYNSYNLVSYESCFFVYNFIIGIS